MATSTFALIRDTRRVLNEGRPGIAQRQRRRLADLVEHARTHSRYFEEAYRGLPTHIEDPSLLPLTNKKLLMERFEDWTTDPDITLDRARQFVDDPARVGEKFLGRYLALTTSGTTGAPGVFVVDEHTLAVTNALALRMLGAWLGTSDLVRIVTRGGRIAMVMATGGHYASAVAAARLTTRARRLVKAYSVQMPLHELVAGLNDFQPAMLAPYAGMGALLASEQEAGRLRIHPAVVVLAAEGLALSEYDRIAAAFQAVVGNSYAATECMFLSYSCQAQWLHVNADWVIVEPVDAQYRPVPAGTPSHSVLITNLSNYTQPIVRYDLGDSVEVRPDACSCGNPLPAIRVKGRSADLLVFRNRDGAQVTVPPLALAADVRGVEQFQIVQSASTVLRVRLRLAQGADGERVWSDAHTALTTVLARYGLQHVDVQRADEAPQQSAGGKFREISPLKNEAHP